MPGRDPEAIPRRPTSPLDSRASPRYDPRVSDTWPPSGQHKREPLLEHVRDVWTLRYVETNCTAVIWRNDFGLELCVEHGGELAASIWTLLRFYAQLLAAFLAIFGAFGLL
jgi:hypothetical protein